MDKLDAERDWTDRTIVSIENPRWADAEKTLLDCDVLFAELQDMGPIPFTATANADTAHGRLIWQEARAGQYGRIADHVPPTDDERRAAADPIGKRQLKLALLERGITQDQVAAKIEAMADGKQKDIARIEWADADRYRRLDPFIDWLGETLGISPADMDALWHEGLSL